MKPEAQVGRFNIRAYGIWINAKAEVLLSREIIDGQRVTKFPGGGLQFGEGLIECLQREWLEETGMIMEVIRHYYTTDYYQPSAFREDEQVMSIYYLVRSPEEPGVVHSLEEEQRFEWVPLERLQPQLFSLPIDQRVGRMLAKDFKGLGEMVSLEL